MIILFGPAGSGKGTQGQILADRFNWRWLSTGDVIRESHRYDDIINRGELIPDADVIDIMHTEVDTALEHGQNVILDGYPRDNAQAEHLLDSYKDQIEGVVVLEVPKTELYERLALRARADDQDRASIDKRLDLYEQNICSMLDLLSAQNIPVERIDGVGTIEEVATRLLDAVKTLNPNLEASND